MKKTISYFSLAILVSIMFSSLVFALTIGESVPFVLYEGQYLDKKESLSKGYVGTTTEFYETKDTTAGVSISKDRVLLGKKLLKRCNVDVKVNHIYTCKYTKEQSSGMYIGTIVRNSGNDNSGEIKGHFYLRSDKTA